MKRLISIFLIILFTGSIFQVVAEENDGGFLGKWGQSFASPSYGVAVMFVTPGDRDDFSRVMEAIPIVGIDLRIFNGTNVAKRGGFFIGYEVGAHFFPTPEEGTSISENFKDSGSNEINYTVDMNYTMSQVFLLSKYGYRLDIGFALIGLSVGIDIGIGAKLSTGNFNISSNYEDPGSYASYYWGSDEGILDLLLDANGEAAIRLGKNFRLFLKLGAMITPVHLPGGTDGSNWFTNESTIDTSDGVNDSELSTLLDRYSINLSPVIVSMRVGFTVSY